MTTFTPGAKRITVIVAMTIATAVAVSAIHAVTPATQPATADLLPPLATSPLPSAKATVVPVPYRPIMPPAMVSHAPRLLALDAPHPLRATPAIDVPPLAASTSALPAAAKLPAGPPIRSSSADVSAVPVGTIAEKPDTGRSTLRTDPSAGMVQSGALIVSPPSRTTSAAAQLLAIPDPSHQPGFIPTPAPASEDPPAASIDRPGPTTLLVTGK